MKRKLLFALALLLSGVCNLWAQTDVTSTYITNADFEGTYSVFVKPKSDRAIYQPDGWTVTRTGSDTNDMTILKSSDLANNNFSAFTVNDATTRGEQTYWTRLRWGNNTGLKLSQTKTLPAGNYKLTAFVLNYNQDVSNNKAEIFAGSNKVAASNSNTKGDGAGWKTLTVNFTLNESAEIEMGVKLTHATENSNNKGEQIVGVDNFKLVYTDFKAELRTVIAQAQAINARISTLGDDITTAQTTLNDASASKTAIESAVSTLRSAISTKLGAYTGLDAAGDDITSFIVNNGFETSPTFDGTSLGSGSDPKSNATPTAGSTLLLNSTNVYQVNGWELMTTETSDFARTFTMPYNNTLYVQSSNAVAGQAVASPTNGSSVTTDNSNLLFVEANWCQNAVLGVKQTIPLPAGSYRLTFDSYVTTSVANANSLCGVSYGETTNYKWPAATNTWTNNEVDFTLTEQKDVTISMGYKKINNVGGGSSAFLFVDNVKLTYFDPVKLAQIQWQETWDALYALDETALPDAAETAITDALGAAEPTTVEGYNSAKETMQALIDSYDGIKAAYDKVLALIDFVTAEKTNSTGTETDIETIEAAINTATTNIETRTEVADLEEDYNTLESARQIYVTGGAQPTSGNVFDYTFKIANAAVTGTDSWSNANVNSGQQYTGAPDNTYFDRYQSDLNVQQDLSSLRAGYYELKAATRCNVSNDPNMYVQKGGANIASTIIANNGNTGAELGNGWSWSRVNFSLKEASDVKIGVWAQLGTGAWAGADDFHLYYKGNAVDDETANALKATVVSGQMNSTVRGNQASALSAFSSAQTIENYAALETAITAASASKDAYTHLRAELDKVPGGLGTTNVYTADSYATNYTNVLAGYDNETISTDDANAYSFGSRVTGAMPAIMLSSWKVDETPALTDASLYMNTWSTEGNSDGSEMTTPFYEYWIADANALGAKTFTATVAGLTAGTSYLVTAKVRVRQQNEQEKADDDVTFQVNNGDVVNAADGTQSEIRPEMYYKTVRATGTADGEGKLAIKVVVKDGNHVSWLAFKDVHYSEVTTPTEEHKTALNKAISEAEAKTIGFEAGEYATYTNIDARKVLAAAKAIDFEVNTDYEVVAATNALTSATWTVNAVEVNAVSNELFNGTEYGAAGWTRDVTWNNVSGGSYSIPAGTMTYGDVAYHEMPLKGNTVYKLTFGHRRWDSNNADNGGQVSVLDSNNQGLDLTAYAGTNSTTLQSGDYYFRTGAAGNYTFTVTATSGRLTFGNVIIKKATDGDLLLEDTETDAPANGYYQTMSTTRTLKGGQWNGFSVPFGFTVAGSALDGASVKQFSSVAENVITMEDATAIVAGKPYLVKPTSDIENPTFDGVTVSNPEEIVEGTGDYTFQAHLYNTSLATDGSVAYVSTTDSSIKKLTSGGIKGMRAIFNIPVANNVKALTIRFGGDADGILSVDADGNITENGAIFNLAGQRVNKAQKGIYIVNGKKVLVK